MSHIYLLSTSIITGHGTADWFQIGKGVHQGCILSPCLFNLYAEYIMRNAGLEDDACEKMETEEEAIKYVTIDPTKKEIIM